SGPEPRSQPKEEHQATLVTAQSLHGGIIDDQAWELKHAGLDWRRAVLSRCLSGPALLVALTARLAGRFFARCFPEAPFGGVHQRLSSGALLIRQKAVSNVVLKARLPPVLFFPLRFAMPPSLPVLPSQAFPWSVTTPTNPAVGTKRIRSLPDSRRAALADT